MVVLASFTLAIAPANAAPPVAELQQTLTTQLKVWKDFSGKIKKLRDLQAVDQGEEIILTGTVDAYSIKGSTFVAKLSNSSQVQSMVITLNANDRKRRALRNSQWGSKFAKGKGNKPIDWLPTWFSDKAKSIMIDQIGVSFQNGAADEAWLSSKIADRFSPLPNVPLNISSPVLRFVISNPGAKKSIMGAELRGNLQAGSLSSDILGRIESADQNGSFVLATSIDRVELGQVLNMVLGGASASALALPQPISSLGMEELKLTLMQRDKSVSGLARTSFGDAEVSVTAEQGLRIGIKPPSDLNLSSIDPALGFIDALGLGNTGLIIAQKAGDSNMSLFQEFGYSETIDDGLTLLGGYSIRAASAEAADFFGIDNVVFKSNVQREFTGMSLEAGIKMPNLQLIPNSDVISLRDTRVKVSPSAAGFEMKLAASLDVKADTQLLTFNTDFALDFVAGSMSASGYLSEVDGDATAFWKNPFGISEGLSVKDLGLLLGVSIRSPIPLPVVGFSGTLIAGNQNNPAFQGKLVLGINPASPQKSVIDASIARLSLGEILKTGVDPSIYSGIPTAVTDVINSVTLEDVRLTVVPSPTGAELFGVQYDPGFLLQGRATIADFSGELYVGLDYTSGLEAQLSTTPIINDFFRLTGARGKEKPMITVIAKDPANSLVALSGLVAIPPLGLEGETDILIYGQGFDFYLAGKVFGGLFQANVEVAGGDLNQGGNLYLKAEMQNDFLDYFKRNISQEIDIATKDMQNKITVAQRDVSNAQQEIRRTEGELVRIENNLKRGRQNQCQAVRNGDQDVRQAAQQVSLAQNTVNNVMNDTNVVRARRNLEVAKQDLSRAQAKVNNIKNEPQVQQHFRDLNFAQQKLAATRRQVNNLQNDPGVVRARQRLNTATSNLAAARRDVNNIQNTPAVRNAQRAFNSAQRDVDSLNGQITSVQNTINNLHARYKNANIFDKAGIGIQLGERESRKAALNVARTTATGVLNVARSAMNGSIQAARSIALQGVNVAQGSVNASKQVYDGSIIAAREVANGTIRVAEGTVQGSQSAYNQVLSAARDVATQGLNIANGSVNASQQVYDGSLRAAQAAGNEGLRAAKITLSGAERAAQGVYQGCMNVPIEQALLLPVRAEKKVAIGLLEAGNLFLEGVKQGGTGTLVAADWIVKNGPLGVLQIDKAGFESCLSAVNGGRIGINFEGKFADSPVSGSFNMDFTEPLSAVTYLADYILQNNSAPRSQPSNGSCTKPSFAGKDGIPAPPQTLALEKVNLVSGSPSDLQGDVPSVSQGQPQ
ncbi:hypothetical protein [Parasphingorhabdus sp.]|uniref:hypothetical protein n=1 Tax=Parasphingorhabdus sp. TaxID=2709688 RepID=UPI003D2ADEB9